MRKKLMKKNIVFMLMIMIVIILGGCICSESSNEFEKKANQTVSIVQENSNAGVDNGKQCSLNNVSLINENTLLPETFPILINEFSYGPEGPLFLVDETMKESMKNELLRYLKLVYNNAKIEENSFKSDMDREFEVYFEKDGTIFRSFMNGLSVLSKDTSSFKNYSEETILENSFIEAAVAFLELDNLKVSIVTEYGSDRSPYSCTYRIYEGDDDLLQDIMNKCFTYIEFTQYRDSDYIVAKIINRKTPKEYDNRPILSYESALAYLNNLYPDTGKRDVKAEVFYSTAVQPGYFMPCYRFYIDTGETDTDGSPIYSVVSILLIDKSIDN